MNREEPRSSTATAAGKKRSSVADWLIRLIKGFVIGLGAIIPGLSGGVLSVIFGVYDRLINFLGNLRQNFMKNLRYFLPIFIGGAVGLLVFSFAVKAAFETYKAQFICLFIGFVIGTFPSLYKEAGRDGREGKHLLIMSLSAAAVFALMLLGAKTLVAVQPSFPVWVASGALIGLGIIVPGLSPSNFLIYFDLYYKMSDGISKLDMSVVVPIAVGVILCILIFSKLVSKLFKKYRTTMYHIILGTVVGSSLVIFPTEVFPALGPAGLALTSLSFWPAVLFCLVMLIVGIVASLLFGKLEEKYEIEEES